MLRQVPQQFTFDYFKASLLQNWKRAAMYAALFILPALALSGIVVAAVRFHFFSWPVTALELLAFLGAGILNVYLLHHESRLFKPSFFLEGVWYSFLLAALMCVVLVLFYVITKTPMEGMAIAGCCMFLLPCIAIQTWFARQSISGKEYKVWYNPDELAPHLVAASNTKQAIRIKIAPRKYETKTRITSISAYAKLKLGRLFHHFLAEQNVHTATFIDAIDKNLHPFGWVFYEEMLGGLFRRHLDPYLSLQENNVKENATIVITRVNIPNKN
jgi:hypothetical protein